MKYCFTTKFWYDVGNDDAALAERLTALFRHPLLKDAVLKPRSLKLPPTKKNLAALLVPTDAYLDAEIDWMVKRQGKAITGRLMLTRNRPDIASRVTSFVDLKFSLSARYKGGPFQSADEVRDAALACMAIGPSLIGVMEVDDEPHESRYAKYTRFREIDDMRVPVSIEWVTILHRDVAANLGTDLRRAERVSGVRVGKRGEYWWVILCPEPFSYAGGLGLATQQAVHRELGLAAAQERFRQVNG